MSNESSSFITDEIKTRNKINQLFHLLREAHVKEGGEKESIINRALEIVSQLYIFQDERVGLLLAQEQAAPAVKKEKEPKSTEREIFSENPFGGKLSEIPIDSLDSLTEESPKFKDFLPEIPESDDDGLTDLEITEEVITFDIPLPNQIHAARAAFLEAVRSEEEEEDIDIISIKGAPKKLPQKAYKLKEDQIERTHSLLTYLQKTQNLKELVEIEAEIEISGNEFNCFAHDGPLEGSSYICPKCKSLYCFKCAIDMHENKEKCKLCGLSFQI